MHQVLLCKSNLLSCTISGSPGDCEHLLLTYCIKTKACKLCFNRHEHSTMSTRPSHVQSVGWRLHWALNMNSLFSPRDLLAIIQWSTWALRNIRIQQYTCSVVGKNVLWGIKLSIHKMKVCSLLLSVLLRWNFSIYSVFDSCVIAYSLKVVSPTNITTPHFGMKECISNYPHALIFAKVHAVVLSKKHQRNSTVQEELTNDGIYTSTSTWQNMHCRNTTWVQK